MSPSDRSAKKRALLAEFDRRRTWPGVVWFATTFGVSRQWVSQLLKKERAARYAKLRHPTIGRRTDLEAKR